MPKETDQSDRTRPYEYYLLFRDRIEREGTAIDSGMKWLFAVEATALLFAAGFTIAAWIGLARQADIVLYNSSYGTVGVTNAVASVSWLAIQGIVCYLAGWKLTRSAETTLQGALAHWDKLIQEGERTKQLWETKHRPADETFAVPSFTDAMKANGLLMTQMELQTIRVSFKLVRLIWLALCVSGAGLWCIQLWILWSMTEPRGIRL